MSDDIVICEKCGAEMKPLSDIYPVGMTCPNCGWGWATTYIEPILSDSTDYHVVLVSSNNSLTSIKAVSEVANCNYIEAKKLISHAPVRYFTDKLLRLRQ